MPESEPEFTRRELVALAGELIGASLSVRAHPGLARLPLNGTIVDETLHLLIVREPRRRRLVSVPKAGLDGSILLGGREIRLKGDYLRVRPEDRTKRLLSRGPKRLT